MEGERERKKEKSIKSILKSTEDVVLSDNPNELIAMFLNEIWP